MTWHYFTAMYAHSIRIKTTDAAKLQDEYAKLVEGLQDDDADAADEDIVMGNPRT